VHLSSRGKEELPDQRLRASFTSITQIEVEGELVGKKQTSSRRLFARCLIVGLDGLAAQQDFHFDRFR
jgi:hypothetical protein